LTLLRQLLIGGGAITMGLFAGFLWVAIRRGLRPLDRLAARIGEMEEASLMQRIDFDGLPRELQPVKDRLNDLLGRLESGMKRERALSADMAHELRSPLAGLRATIEVALSRPRAPEQYCEAFTDGLRITGQMQSLVENLLSMARLEAGQIDIHPETVSLNEVVQSHLAPVRDAIRARDLKLQWDPGRAATVVTDPALVGAVVRNVLENAVTYTNEGGAVRIDATQAANGAKLKVSNSGSALTEDQVVHVFDRFWRGDASRGMNGSHCGLGLALVKRMVDVLGGEVKATSSAGGTFEISLSIPSARAAKSSGDATPDPRP
jgi:signal transduction histidine kinase